MKRKIYIALFALLGFLVQFLVHGVVESWYIDLLVKDFPTFSLGLSWDEWFLIHHVLSVVLALGGLVLGFFQGRFWYNVVYIKYARRFGVHKHYVCPSCGGVSDHPKKCETSGCSLEGHELVECSCSDGKHSGVIKSNS